MMKERRNAAIYDGFALVRLGRMEDAMLTIEQGRARRLTEALQLNRADPLHISDVGRRRRYQEARQALLAAQAALNTPLSHHLTEHERRRRLLECTEAAVVAMAVFDEA